MGHWDDVSAARAALAKKLGKQLASDFRHDRYGEVFLALDPEEREPLLATGPSMNEKVRALADALAAAGRMEEALTLYEAVAPRLHAALWMDVLPRIDGSPSVDATRLRRVLASVLPRIGQWCELGARVARAACGLGDVDLAIEAARAGIAAGLDPDELSSDPALVLLHDDPRFAEASRALFPPREPSRAVDLPSLSRAWNDAGRAHLVAQHPRLVAIYERGEDAEIASDPRDPALADAVIDAVVSLRDEPGRARSLFDPAAAPLVHRFPPREGLPILFATILGADDVLARVGPSYRSARVLRLREGRAELVGGVIAVAANRPHTLLALARPRVGIEVRSSLEGPVLGTFSWPDLGSLVPRELLREATRGEPLRIESMRLSGDGTRVLVIGYRQGVLLGSRRAGEPPWRYVGGAGDDMLHGDLSDDGCWLVHGSQGSLHEILSIDDDGAFRPHASVGPRSEYPHCAVFTDDARGVALNACHFYSGVTGYLDVSAARGTRSDHYADTPLLRVIDDALRVYAAAWLPAEVTQWLGVDGAFALVGAGVVRIVSSEGVLVVAQVLASSGSSADFHPGLGLLAVGTYAGMLHVFDVRRGADVGTQDGWTRGGASAGLHEARRWLLWPELPGGPVAW